MKKKYQFHSRKEKIEYFFDYYKGHVIVIALIILVLMVFIGDIAMQPDYDYIVGLVTVRPYGKEALQEISDELSAFGEDLNGDGLILVNTLCYSFIEEDQTSETIAEVKFYADYEMELTDIYFVEPPALKHVIDNGDFINETKQYPWDDVVFQVICRSSAIETSKELWHCLP